MKHRRVDKTAADRTMKEPRLDGRHRDADGEIRQKRADTTLGLMAFEKISAVEGVRLSNKMREDLRSLDAKHMDAGQRSRFIIETYGKK